jgi:hypothetical protein
VRRLGRIIAISSTLAAVIALGSATTAVSGPLGGGEGALRWVSVSVNGDGAGSSGGASGCSWREYANEIDSSYANKFDLPSYQENKDKPGKFYWIECGDETELRYVADSVPAVDPFLMAEYARRFIQGRQASVNVNPTKALVKLPTWFWVDNNAGNIAATASVINQRATVTAEPDRVEWDLDGETKTCPYPGEAFVAGRHAPTATSNCYEEFTKAVKGMNVRARIIYTVTWTAEGAVYIPTPQPLPDLPGPFSPVTNLDINEVQTINR